MRAEDFIIVNREDGKSEDILGKFMYFSLPKLYVNVDTVNDICEQIGFPVKYNGKPPIIDAFRNATGEIHDRIEETVGLEKRICKIFCRDNMRVEQDIISRELVEETLNKSTNKYRKLANITLDKETQTIELSDVDMTSGRDIQGYFDRIQKYFNLYRECLGNQSIETMAEKYISGMHAIGISAWGHHYFVPKAYMQGVSLLEDFLMLVADANLFTYANKRDAKHISMNAMFVVDNEEQCKKMTQEFYHDLGSQIAEYQKRIGKLIQNGNTNQKVLDRWILKIQMLATRKKEYETILHRDLSGMDEEFSMLESMCQNYKMTVKRSQIFGVAA